jgi:transposase
MDHTVKLMAPRFVQPCVKTNKTDATDAEAICKAVSLPNMPFVAIKTEEQQALLAIHRARQGFVKTRTAQSTRSAACWPDATSSGCKLPVSQHEPKTG